MPGFVLHMGAVVQCTHAGLANPTSVNPRVTVSGQAIVTLINTYSVAGCAFPAMSGGLPPCATAQWTMGAARVTSMGQPVLLQTSTSVCVPTGTPLIISATQLRVSAT
ncbi:MAG: hypothetical protein V4754_13715 [Pseudomonadota bacterium]